MSLSRQTVTAYEWEALDKLQRGPAQLYELTPNGMEFSKANYELQRWRDRRMDYIHTRLTVKSFQLKRDFDRER